MNIKIISVGKKPRGPEKELIDGYCKRIQKPWSISWMFIQNAQGDTQTAKKTESDTILKTVRSSQYVVLLDERGECIDNNELSGLLSVQKSVKDVVFIIGGPYGVSDEVRARANRVIQISSLILPHRLVRVILAEQLYRSQSLIAGHPYHHS